MNFAESFSLGIALAVDASAAAFSCGLSARTHRLSCPLKLAVVAGTFQGAMPIAGFFAAESVVGFIGEWAPRIAFAVFLVLGTIFIRNAWFEQEKGACSGCKRCVADTWKGLFALGIATSIDALAVGAGIACAAGSASHAGTLAPSLGEKIFVPAAIIAGTTFLCVFSAFHAARIFRRLPVKLLGTLAGLILVALGFRALFA